MEALRWFLKGFGFIVRTLASKSAFRWVDFHQCAQCADRHQNNLALWFLWSGYLKLKRFVELFSSVKKSGQKQNITGYKLSAQCADRHRNNLALWFLWSGYVKLKNCSHLSRRVDKSKTLLDTNFFTRVIY